MKKIIFIEIRLFFVVVVVSWMERKSKREGIYVCIWLIHFAV